MADLRLRHLPRRIILKQELQGMAGQFKIARDGDQPKFAVVVGNGSIKQKALRRENTKWNVAHGGRP